MRPKPPAAIPLLNPNPSPGNQCLSSPDQSLRLSPICRPRNKPSATAPTLTLPYTPSASTTLLVLVQALRHCLSPLHPEPPPTPIQASYIRKLSLNPSPSTITTALLQASNLPLMPQTLPYIPSLLSTFPLFPLHP
ncbi:hypothetical protein E2C01_022496 [Portunus trituberculatus]|uniref:Uncharacterized protein n=1 Tax=Portunus trituberculatus TaxID=210409 RepID=A0A5B7E5I8_PORTR|nr:hypothetical protein [Portunus trituberculatus]